MQMAPGTTATVTSMNEAVLHEQVASAFANLRTAALTDRAVAAVLAGLLYWQTGHWVVLAWLGLHWSSVLRRPLWSAYERDPKATQRSPLWAKRFSQAVMINSAIWGLAPLLFLNRDNAATTTLMMVVLMGTCATGALAVAPLKQALPGYIAPMMLGLTIALALRGDPMSLFLAACCVAFLLTTLKYAVQQNRTMHESLTARFEKEALAEQLAQQNLVTQRASDEKTRFFAAASHDLRQPLHAIALFGAVLEKKLAGQPEHTDAVRLMRAVHALGASLDTMLDVSRLDAGVVAPDRQALPLARIFLEIDQVFAQRAEEKGLQLRVRSTQLWVRSDPALLLRLLSNLVENAIKYTGSGGVLVVARARGPAVWIDTVDTGIGIAPEHAERVFDEFYQVDNPGRDRTHGLGIGLSIVRRLSDLLDHPVRMHSVPGRGSRFRVVLSGADPPPEASATALPVQVSVPAPDPLALPRRVLLIDDETDIAEAVSAFLGAWSLDIQTVTDEASAAQALQAAIDANQRFEALICDYRLADGVDGLSAALRLRERFDPQLPVLLVTGETSPERLLRVHGSGVPVLFKPVEAKMLLHALADLTAPGK